MRSARAGSFFLLGLMLLLAPVARAQSTSASLSGVVVDAQGAAVPGARVAVTDVIRGNTLEARADASGRFIFPQLQPATYVVKVAAEGFKTFVKHEVVLHANDRIALEAIALELGALSETVQVMDRGTELQAASGERGYTLNGKVLEDIAVNSRSYLALVTLAPGVVHTNAGALRVAGHAGLEGISANGSRGNMNNLTLDGIGNVDTGNNGDQLATLSLDAVAEFKILTSNYQAEYGRTAGAQISVVTKSGGRDFHGSAFLYRRHDSMNANNWRNNRDGAPRAIARYNDFGYTIGGPIVVPGVFNEERSKLFFFLSQEFQKQLRPQGERRVTFPTLLERQGDFSQSVDSNGNPFPYIRDWTTGLPCSATNTAGCFKDGGVLGRIPKDRLYAPGLAILDIFPEPNAPGNRGFNYVSQISDDYPRREDMLRLDWQPSDRWRVFARYVNNNDSLTSAYGSFVLGSNFPLVPIQDVRPGSNFVLSSTRTLSASMVHETVVGFGHNAITIEPVDDGLSRRHLGLTDLPAMYPDAIQMDLIPRLEFGGARISNSPAFGTNNGPFKNYNTTFDVVNNVTKVTGAHTLKAGLYVQRNWKDETSDVSSINGTIQFGDSGTNPYDTGFGFANAAVGVYRSFQQASRYAEGKWRYWNVEWYLQDNWKVDSRLTLDYGVRFYWIQPQYDAALQTSTFLPELWDPAQAPRLFMPALNAAGQRVGVDPVTGRTVSALDIGKIVPGTGDALNGIRQAGQGVSKYLMEDRGIHWAPRVGFAWDMTGRQQFVLRGGMGVFFDRIQGNEPYAMLTNPPTTFAPTLLNGLLQDVNPSSALRVPQSIHLFSFGGHVPTIYNYSLGVQTRLPHQLVLDVSYVGSQSRHLVQRRNLNAVPYGAAYKPENQDPTRVAANPNAVLGTNALDADFLRPYRGYSTITLHGFGATANYNSLQTTLNRRFAKGHMLGVSYTWSRALGTADSDTSSFRIDGREREAHYAPLNTHRKHNLSVNFIYELPKASAVLGGSGVVKALLDNWQVSGIYRYMSGSPYGIGYSIPGIGNVQLTGSQTEGARIRRIGDAGSGHDGDDPYRMFDTSAFTIPQPGSLGLEAARNFLVGPGVDNLDLSVQKTIPLGRGRRVQLRVDAFNALNHTQFSGVNSTLSVRSLTDPTPLNLAYDANGVLVNRTGFGAVSGAREPRILQLVARFQF